MSSLKSFIVQEELKVNHAERFLKYLSHYHTDVLLDITRSLRKAWEIEVAKLIKKYPPNSDAVQDAQLKNGEALITLTASSRSEKIITSRSATPVNVSPSVKIPFVYSDIERLAITKQLLSVAENSLEKITRDWREIFNHEKKGQLAPSFRIARDSDEIRFQLRVQSEGSTEEFYKTLYVIRLEYGKPTSKLRPFDRLYLYAIV